MKTYQCRHCDSQVRTDNDVPQLWITIKGIGFTDIYFCTYRCLWGFFNHGAGTITGGDGYVHCPCGHTPQITGRLLTPREVKERREYERKTWCNIHANDHQPA